MTYSAYFVSPVTVSLYAWTSLMPPVYSLPQVIAPRLRCSRPCGRRRS
ncbi:hypothetical protein [Amycolatopsis oliviviridis]|nr:hypothetical protein [Amycolatopsis oliviviridis]